ncbi:hypothetical protein NC652_018234 [Populus alba x Populus x berolinensis]|nr:hypothetical protein NC652_018234 [Populus alba x Populus x berolinensis]
MLRKRGDESISQSGNISNHGTTGSNV